MYLVHPDNTTIELLPHVGSNGSNAQAANDAGSPSARSRDRIHDVNLLVAEVAGRVAAHVQPSLADVELDLAPGIPEIDGDAALIGFVIAGVLVSQLRSLEDTDDGVVRIKTGYAQSRVTISILGNGVPLLGYVRAVEEDVDADPTMVHCRRLLEQLGGKIKLRDDGGMLGFELSLPWQPNSPALRLLPSAPAEELLPAIALAS